MDPEDLKKYSCTIEKMVRNYSKEQFALAWCFTYFGGETPSMSDSLRYMREYSQGKDENNDADYLLFINEDFPEGSKDREHLNIINKHLKETIKEYFWDYKLYWDVANRAFRRAFDEINKTVLQTN